MVNRHTGSEVPETQPLLTGCALLTCGRNKSEKAPQQVLSRCLPCKQPWPRYNMTPESRATRHPRWWCRGFSCKYFSIAWLIPWTGTNSSYARGWNTSLSNSVLDLLFNWHSVYTPNSLCCWSTPSLHQRYLGLCIYLKLQNIYISKQWCKMLRYWKWNYFGQKILFIFQWPPSSAIHIAYCRPWFQTTKRKKPWQFYYFRAFSEKNALRTVLSLTTHNSYSKYTKLRETCTYSQRHSLPLFSYYIINDLDYRLQNKSFDSSQHYVIDFISTEVQLLYSVATKIDEA